MSYSAFLPLQTRQVELMPKSLILVSSDHILSSQSSLESFKCSLANFRRPCNGAFLSRGTWRVLRSVLPMVFLVTVVQAALRSFTSSPCVVLGLFCTFRMITDTAQGDILHGAPDLERLVRSRQLLVRLFVNGSNTKQLSIALGLGLHAKYPLVRYR